MEKEFNRLISDFKSALNEFNNADENHIDYAVYKLQAASEALNAFRREHGC